MFSLPIGSPHTPSHPHRQQQQQHAPQPLQTIPVHVPPIGSVCTYLSQAVDRWLKPNELQAILIQLKSCHYQWTLPPSPPSSSPFASLSSLSGTPLPLLSLVAPHRPRPGSIFVYSKKHSTRWRKDHYRWQKEERHTKLKVNRVDLISCYYSKCAESSSSPSVASSHVDDYLGSVGSFQRRGYCLISDPDIVLVHYLSGRVKGAAAAAAAESGSGSIESQTLKFEEEEEGESVLNTSTSSIKKDSTTPSEEHRAIDLTEYIHYFMDSPPHPRSHQPHPHPGHPPSSMSSSFNSSLPSSVSFPYNFPINVSLQLHPHSSNDHDAGTCEINEFNYEEYVQQQQSQPPLPLPSSQSMLSALLMPNENGIAAATTTAPFHHASNPYSPGKVGSKRTNLHLSNGGVGAVIGADNGRSGPPFPYGHSASPSRGSLHELLGLDPPLTGADGGLTSPTTTTATPFHLQRQQQQQHQLPSHSTATSSSHAAATLGSPSSFSVLDYSPTFDFTDGCSKILFCLGGPSVDRQTRRYVFCHLYRIAGASENTSQPSSHQQRHPPPPSPTHIVSIELEHLSGDTFRATLPHVTQAGEYVFVLNETHRPPSSSSIMLSSPSSRLYPFTFKSRVDPPPTTATLHPPRQRPTVIRTRSRGDYTRDTKLRRGNDASRSPSKSPAPTTHTNRTTRTMTVTPLLSDHRYDVSLDSHEREFVIGLIHRVRELERASNNHAQTHASTIHSPRSYLNIASPTFAQQQQQQQHDHLHFLNSPPRGRLNGNDNRDSNNTSHALSIDPSIPSGVPSSTGNTSSFTLHDLESCILDAPGEDLIESLLLATIKKVMEADAKALKQQQQQRQRDDGTPSSPYPTHTYSPTLLAAAAARDSNGRQLIHYVAGLGYTNLLTLLLSHLGGDVNSRDGFGRTPLHHAALVACDDVDDDGGISSSPAGMMVSALLSFGADDSILDQRGFTPLALADAATNTPMVQVFLEIQNAEQIGQEQMERQGGRRRRQRNSIQTAHGQERNDGGEQESDNGVEHVDVDDDDENDVVDLDIDVVDDSDLHGGDMAVDSPPFDDPIDRDDDDDDMDSVFDPPASSSAPLNILPNSSSSPSKPDGNRSKDVTNVGDGSVGGVGGLFPLDRAFSSLTLQEMGINAQDFVLPSLDGAPPPTGSLSASAIFASPSSHFTRVVSAIQRQIRWWLFRRHAAANKLQSLARGMLARRSMKRMREASVTIQSKFRQIKVRRDFVKLQRATRIIQEKFRKTSAAAYSSAAASSATQQQQPQVPPASQRMANAASTMPTTTTTNHIDYTIDHDDANGFHFNDDSSPPYVSSGYVHPDPSLVPLDSLAPPVAVRGVSDGDGVGAFSMLTGDEVEFPTITFETIDGDEEENETNRIRRTQQQIQQEFMMMT